MGARLTVDDGFHVPSALDYFWTETNWFALVIPDRKITDPAVSVLSNQSRRVLGGRVHLGRHRDSGGTAATPRTSGTCRSQSNRSLTSSFPTDFDTRHWSHSKVRYRLRLPDGEDVHLDVVWEGVVAANRGLSGNHLDQPGRIRGTLVLDGETIDIDGVGFRDRTWSPRSQFGQGVAHSPPWANLGTSLSSDDGFFLLSGNVDEQFMDYSLLDGILFRDGESAKLAEAQRRIVERDPQHGCPIALRIDLVDEKGRSAHIEGTNVNRFIVNLYPSLLVWECQTHWTMDGVDLVGEDEDNWGIHDFRRFVRTLRAIEGAARRDGVRSFRPSARLRARRAYPGRTGITNAMSTDLTTQPTINVLDPEFYVEPWAHIGGSATRHQCSGPGAAALGHIAARRCHGRRAQRDPLLVVKWIAPPPRSVRRPVDDQHG